MRKPSILCCLLSVILVLGCESEKSVPEPDRVVAKKPASKASAAPAASAAASSSAGNKDEAKADYGPSVEIPAGTLKVGSRCQDVPRIRPNELEFEAASMGTFRMDVYPYPNKEGEPALLNQTQEKAAQLCAARGKRLCTELEWERACKGAKNKTFMWGNGFKKGRCPGQLDHKTGARPKCTTEFGVKDMMGVAMEWTSSDWERGSASGDKVVRGARAEKVSWLSARCAHSRKRNPHMTYDNVGFRCCSGPVNAARVVIRQKKRAVLEEEPSADTNFEMTMMKAMPRDHRGIVDVELSFDTIYRWHPVANEEVILARWKAKPDKGKPYYEYAVFKLCGKRAWRAAKFRGPVETVSKPKVAIRANRLSFDVEAGGEKGVVKMIYWAGTVRVVHPKWLKKGNSLDADSKESDAEADDKKAADNAKKIPSKLKGGLRALVRKAKKVPPKTSK